MNRYFVHFVLLMTLVFLSTSNHLYAEETEAEKFLSANQKLHLGQEREAIQLIEELLAENPYRGYLRYDLAVLYERVGQKGRALVQAQLAEKMIPRYQPLQSLRSHLIQSLPAQGRFVSEVLLSSIYPFTYWLTNMDWILLTVAVALFFVSFVVWRHFRPKTGFSLSLILSGLLYIYMMFGIYLNRDADHGRGIVVSKSAVVRNVFMDNDPIKFEIFEGQIVHILDEHQTDGLQSWYRIELPRGDTGWVAANDVLKVSFESD